MTTQQTPQKRRKEFLKMLRDCDRGKIDLIITKSVSRFGRNTLDGLDTVRKLKRKGIGVFFEKENTNTLIDRDTFQRVQEELARRSSLRKTSSKTKTELGKYCGKYVLSELLVCGECGSPYRRVVWSRAEGKRIVWRCINRLEHGKKICKKSPTWNETDIQAAVTAAMNELFHTQTAKEALEASITAALAGEDGELSLPTLEAQIRSLTERQLELFQLAVSAGPDCLEYDEEIQRVNMAKTTLMAKKAELEREGRTAASRMGLRSRRRYKEGDCMIYINGDTHGGFQRFSTLFVDGNHENFDMLNTFPVYEWQGGKVHYVRPHVLHLMRGQVFEIGGITFFTMGGAASHDIQDGILDPASPGFEQEYWFKRRTRQIFRVKGVSWWPQELPSEEEYEEAVRNLERVSWRVDCILTHCAPTSIQQKLDRNYIPDRLTDFLQMVKRRCQFDYWFLSHYHRNCAVDDRFIVQWEQMVELQWE